MGKYAASAIAAHCLVKNKKTATVAELVEAYNPTDEKKLCDELKTVMNILRNEVEISYDEVIFLEKFLKGKKSELETKLHLHKSAGNNDPGDAPTINYSQKKIGNKFYWYKQYTENGKNITQYVKDSDMKKEKVDVSRITISFHPEFKPEKK